MNNRNQKKEHCTTPPKEIPFEEINEGVEHPDNQHHLNSKEKSRNAQAQGKSQKTSLERAHYSSPQKKNNKIVYQK